MKSWKLRRPSARLKARLFPSPAAIAECDVPLLAARHWLAPALGVCLLALLMVHSSSSQWTGWGSAQSSNLLATVALNQPLLAR